MRTAPESRIAISRHLAWLLAWPLLSVALGAGCGPTPAGSQAAVPHHPRIIPMGAPPTSVPEPSRTKAERPDARQSPQTKRKPEPEPEPVYELDRVSRKIPITGKAYCPPIELVDYRGAIVRFHKPLRINTAFREHVREFEQIVRDTAMEVYGRPPTKIRHFGSFYCRRISTWPYLVSEHGLGNAVDIGGFDFSRLGPDEFPEVQKRWRKAFSIRMARHWRAKGKEGEHSRFLQLLARRIIDRPGLFRVILGPAHPNHNDHLHLDMARGRVVNVF